MPFLKRHTKHDFGFDWIVLLGEDGGLFSDSLCLFWAGCDSPSFDFIVPL